MLTRIILKKLILKDSNGISTKMIEQFIRIDFQQIVQSIQPTNIWKGVLTSDRFSKFE